MKNRIILSFIGLITFAAIELDPSIMHASTCAEPLPVKESLSNADTVFIGRCVAGEIASKTGKEGEYGILRFTFEISRAFKGGNKNARIVIETESSSRESGYNFMLGQTYLVYAYRKDGSFWTDYCTRTQRNGSPEAKAEIEEIEAYLLEKQ